MYLFFQCVAESVAEKGLRGLAELVPGGGAMYDIAEGAWKKYRERYKDAQQRDDIQQMAQASFDQVKQAAIEAARKAATGQPEILPALELYLTQIPAAIRQSLKRSQDPTGKTVPLNFVLRGPDDVAKLLPAALPRFRPGAALPGKTGWVLDRQLGVGGFGEVWLARQMQFQSLMGAVKFCRNLQNRDRDMLHESKVIDRLFAHGSHPNIVKLLDIHLDGDSPWLMYEYVDAGDLADLIYQWANLPANERQQKTIAALHELAQAIGHFHRLAPAIVHRDLKPANILRDKMGRLRITDFGISGVAARQSLENETRGVTTRAGRLQSYLYGSYTPLYASPQQRDGAEPDPRDDVHAFGVIGFQMLTGQLSQGVGPDFAEDLKEAGVDAELVELLRRCTATKAERRPRDAGEVADTLARLISRGSDRPAPPRSDPDADIYQDEKDYIQAYRRASVKEFLQVRAPERFARWKEAAHKGLASAENLYALCFDWGIGITQNQTEAVSWYRRAAEKGNALAQYNLGSTYEFGRGMPIDLKQALVWYRKAAEQESAAAQRSLGYMHQFGRGVPQDDIQAAIWYRKAADQGYAIAQCDLGFMYQFGRGVSQDDFQAAAWYRKAAEQGDVTAQRNLGYMYQFGRGVPQDDHQAAIWYRKAADQGYASAQRDVGLMYQYGRGAVQDDVQAVAWYRKAADQGYAIAQCDMGFMYENGRGVPKDYAMAVMWYRKSAELGDPTAQRNMGYMYQFGRGVAQDDAQAVVWYRKSAEQGYAIAQCDLGFMYKNGRGVPQDDVQALAWYRKAADQGNTSAQRDVGLMYQYGRGVPPDDAQAVAWFRRAAEQGYAIAQCDLGYMYENGRGLPKDYGQAVFWYRKSADQGNADAQFNLGLAYEYAKGVYKDLQQAVAWYRKAAQQGYTAAKTALQRLGY